jgi:hypothetical protein
MLEAKMPIKIHDAFPSIMAINPFYLYYRENKFPKKLESSPANQSHNIRT